MNGPADWIAAQQQLWRAWQSLMTGSHAGGPAATPFSPEHFAQFWPPFGQAGSFANSFTPWRFGQSDTGAGQSFNAWLNRLLESMQRAAAGPAGGTDPTAWFTQFLQQPLNNFGGFGERDADPFGAAAWMNMKPSEFAAFFDLPPLGLTREWEEKLRELQAGAKAQWEAGAALARQGGRIYAEALKRFTAAVREDDPADGEITTLRGLYDFWVEIAETVYRERVMTDEYAQVFGRYVNAQARARKAWQTLVSDYQAALGLPNRREIDSLIEQHATLSARVRELEAREHESPFDVDALIAKVNALETQVGVLSAAPSAAAAPAPVRAKRKAKKSRAAASLPATRVGPAASKPAKTRKRPKSKSKPKDAGAGAEFDIGSLAGGS